MGLLARGHCDRKGRSREERRWGSHETDLLWRRSGMHLAKHLIFPQLIVKKVKANENALSVRQVADDFTHRRRQNLR